ncbi:MAG: sigma-70 family RNA polymerase sigma factor [Clostridia bacterium]|nr:sigma-70 family RNA polymerase sigma factor [Clostridia bacterium]
MDLQENLRFEQLLTPIEALLFSIILKKVQNRESAKEIFHNTVVSALMGFHLLRDEMKFPGWIITIALNETKRFLKKERRMHTSELPVDITDPVSIPLLSPPVSESSVEEIVLGLELQQRLKAALATLSAEERLILFMAYEQSLPLRTIADATGMTLAAVKMRKRRTLDKLRAMLET